MGTAGVKREYSDVKTKTARSKFAKSMKEKNFRKAAKISVITAVINSGSNKLFKALRQGSRIYKYSKE
ncbi:MAG: hypothetical protein ACTSRG_19570 [Candidatus Helarchaeota archaeon]